MPVLRSIPAKKIINGIEVKTSESAIITENNYITHGEYVIVIKGVETCILLLDSKTTDHIVVKALTNVIIRPDKNKIDEQYDEVEINKGACVEFYFMGGSWYVLSSDGLKLSSLILPSLFRQFIHIVRFETSFLPIVYFIR